MLSRTFPAGYVSGPYYSYIRESAFVPRQITVKVIFDDGYAWVQEVVNGRLGCCTLVGPDSIELFGGKTYIVRSHSCKTVKFKSDSISQQVNSKCEETQRLIKIFMNNNYKILDNCNIV